MLSFDLLTEIETERYENWRKNHKCLSSVEFRIIPNEVSQAVRVCCLACNEEINITDFESW